MTPREELTALRRLAELEAKAAGGAPAAPAADAPGYTATIAAGLGKGVGQVALGAQRLLGRGLQSVSMTTPGDWLVKDADAGKAKIAAAFAPYKEANPLTAGASELGGEILATLPVGGALAAPFKAASRAVPALQPFANALSSAGFTTGSQAAPGFMGVAKNLLTRSGAGAAVGGTAASLVDPETAGTGAAIGGVLPGALQIAGKVGNAASRFVRGPAQAPDLTQAIQAARGAGYVVPPTQARPTLGNRLIEGMSGKITTAQNASAKNAGVTADLAASALGLPAGTKITPEILNDVRATAGRAYADIGSTGMVTPSAAYESALDKIAQPFKLTAGAFPNAAPSPVLKLVDSLRSPAFASASAVEKIKQLRTAADDAFRSGNTDVGRAAKAGAAALEDAVEDHLRVIGQPELLAKFQDARKLIAKTYSVQGAMNPVTGAIDARKIAAQLARGKPLSGDLRTIGEFAARFPKASQTVEGMGSLPQSSPLDWHALGATSLATGSPLPMLGIAARPMARAAALSPMVQNRLAQAARSPNALQQMLADPEIQKLILRGAPVAAADR